MKQMCKNICFLGVLFLFFNSHLFAQDINARRNKKEEKEKQIYRAESSNRLFVENNQRKRKTSRIQIIRANTLIEKRNPRKNRRKKSDVIYTLLGKARFRFENSILESPKIKIKNLITANMSRGFKLTDLDSGIILTARNAFLQGNKGIVKINKKLKLTNRNKRFRLYANQAVRFLNSKKTYLSGSLRLLARDVLLTGKVIIQDDKQSRISIYGSPELSKKNMRIQSKVISYDYKKNKVVLIGTVTMTFRNTFAQAGEISFFLNQPDRIFFTDKIFFSDKDKEIRSENLVFETTPKNRIIARSGVQMIDNKYQMNIRAEQMFWQERKISLLGDANLKIRLKDKKKFLEISGETIIRDFTQKNTIGRQNIEVTYENRNLIGEKLDYDEKADEIMIRGNPSIIESGLTIMTNNILFYPEEDKLVLTKEVQAQITAP